MATWSKWELHPSLMAALANGQTFEEWLGRRKPAASYARISRDIRDAIGVARQHDNNDHFAKAHDIAIVVRYTDNHITAANPDIGRPAFLRLIRDLRARRCEEGYPIHGLMAVEDKRVARLPEDHLRLYRALTVDELGFLGLYDNKQLMNVQSDAEMIRGLLQATLGEIEVRTIKKRKTRNAQDLAREGAPYGPRRFGWLPKDVALGRMVNEVLCPVESPILRDLIGMRLEGASWRSLHRELITRCREAAVKLENELEPSCSLPAKGAQEKRDHIERLRKIGVNSSPNEAIKYMVTNPANCGYRILDDELVANRHTGEPVIGRWQTICTPEEWKKLIADTPVFWTLGGAPKRSKAKKSNRTRQEFADQTRKYLGSGLLRCGATNSEGEQCLSRMTGSITARQSNYRCTAANCHKIGRNMKWVDLMIEEIAVKVLMKNHQNKKPKKAEWYGEETLRKLREKKTEMKSRFTEDPLANPDIFDMLDDLNTKIKDAEADKANFYQEQDTENFLSEFSEEKWKSWDLRQKRIAIDTALSSIVVLPLPKGRSRRAPFDPNLLVPYFRKKEDASVAEEPTDDAEPSL